MRIAIESNLDLRSRRLSKQDIKRYQSTCYHKISLNKAAFRLKAVRLKRRTQLAHPALSPAEPRLATQDVKGIFENEFHEENAESIERFLDQTEACADIQTLPVCVFFDATRTG